MVHIRDFVDRLGLRVLVEGDGLDRPVRWVHVSELDDPTPFLRGGEFLLVTGTNLALDRCVEYVRRLRATGIAALGLGVEPVYDATPAELVDACREFGLTLLELPADVPFMSVSRLLYDELVAEETLSLKRMSDSHRLLIRAATGPDPIRAVIGEVAAALDAWVMLVDHNTNRRWDTRNRPPPGDVAGALRTVGASTRPTSFGLVSPRGHVEVQWVAGPAPTGYAIAVGKATVFTPMDRAIVGIATSALPLLFGDPQRWPVGDLGAATVAAALWPDSADDRFGGLFGGRGDAGWLVVVGGYGTVDGLPAEDRFRALSDLLETPLVDVSGQEFVAIVATPEDTDRLRILLDGMATSAGVGGPVPWDRLDTAHAGARGARAAALARRRTVVEGTAGGRLSSALSPDAARAFARSVLAPLTAEKSRAGDLLVTLRTWLANHGGWDRTAAVLGVHRNTVRHRIGQVERLLGLDLADPDVRMELWFALRWSDPDE
jgi:purine catabolism regulator